jgi:diaminohydroxyphosphoribosylaminopyrimidine deaminase/5-amino-6-(5-phosphoribosylamino)uracil reductase
MISDQELIIAEANIQRCLSLAQLGAGCVAPNPMVGAVLLYDGQIIGEGYHQRYGEAHAEVNCLDSVSKMDELKINKSTLYVSLEPCTHHGKTPPCSDLIIKKSIPKVVVGCIDPFAQVNGKGIEKLRRAGIEVVSPLLEQQCVEINKRFFTFQKKHRPYVILKWAESADGKLANADYSRAYLSSEFSNRLVHKWRLDEASLLIGTNTAYHDDPTLNQRHWKGPDPTRIILDLNLRLPHSLKIFDKGQNTIILNLHKNEVNGKLIYSKIDDDVYLINNILKRIYELKINSVMVEGGTRILQTFIDSGIWDEARVIRNQVKTIGNGIEAPILKQAQINEQEELTSDLISYYSNLQNEGY